jgi:hypothetical protein
LLLPHFEHVGLLIFAKIESFRLCKIIRFLTIYLTI